MNHRENNAKLKEAKQPEDKTSNNGRKPTGPPATGMPVALGKGQLEAVPTMITPKPAVWGESGGQAAKRWRGSKFNAITHGIFGPVVLEGRESAKDYDRLVRSLRECWQPEGVQEELLVGQLATYYWRMPRVFEAGNAEIHKGMHSLRCENEVRQQDELRQIDAPTAPFFGGLLRKRRNPLIIHRCVEILRSWRKGLAEHGLNFEHDMDTLRQIYGHQDLEMCREGLPFAYCIVTMLRKQVDELKEGGGLTREEAKRALRKEAKKEIKKLVRLEKKVKKEQNERLRYEESTHMVPVDSERSMKYEAMFSRGIHRTMNELERVQRLRRGERIPPAVELDVSL